MKVYRLDPVGTLDDLRLCDEAVPHPGGVTFKVSGETESVPKDMQNLAARAADDLLVTAGLAGEEDGGGLRADGVAPPPVLVEFDTAGG